MISVSSTAAGQPGDSEPRGILGIIGEAVEGITEADIEDQLRETLSRAGYLPSQPADGIAGERSRLPPGAPCG